MDIDIKKIRELSKIVRDNDLTSIKIVAGEEEVLIQKESPQVQTVAPQVVQPVITEAAPIAAQEASTVSAPAAAPEVSGGEVITSPMVGTFYSAPSPGALSFVKSGDEVNEDTVVCIVEAMKVMNEIKAGKSGVIQEVLVQNAQPVEFGQPLYRLKSS